MSENNFDWIPFYKELAEKLLIYKDNRQALIQIIKSIYIKLGMKLLEFEDKDGRIFDVDPFTTYVLFNKGIADENRKKIMAELANSLSIQATVPKMFNGVPVAVNFNSAFCGEMGNRKREDFDNLWNLFEAALNYANNKTELNRKEVEKWIDEVIKIKYNKMAKVTMGLYWIAPEEYLSLDTVNVDYIFRAKQLPESVVNALPNIKKKFSGSIYFSMLNKISNYLNDEASKFKTYYELSYAAWKASKSADVLKNKSNAFGTTRYWIYAPGDYASKWNEFYEDSIMAIGWNELGDIQQFSSRDDVKEKMKQQYGSDNDYMNDSLAIWQFAKDVQIGDIVYAKKGTSQLVGRGIVTSDYKYDSEGTDGYNNVRSINWTHKGEWSLDTDKAPVKTLTEIVNDEARVAKFEALINGTAPTTVDNSYGKEQFLEKVYMKPKDFDMLIDLVKQKKNVILQGSPGVGKTYIAKRLAYAVMEEKDDTRIQFIQFHQSYSYEDFIMGRWLTANGIELREGIFYKFCKEAKKNSDKKYFFIIDEINRGNMSKIFGELFMLIEADKRNKSIQLLYKDDEKFQVPENLYIIGTMNTADRSLAMLDYALRRRFAFYDIVPAFGNDKFKQYIETFKNEKLNKLRDVIVKLNNEIAGDASLGEGFAIGHSYFCNMEEASDLTLHRIVEFELIPLLKEYWFDERSKVTTWSENLRRAINDSDT